MAVVGYTGIHLNRIGCIVNNLGFTDRTESGLVIATSTTYGAPQNP